MVLARTWIRVWDSTLSSLLLFFCFRQLSLVDNLYVKINMMFFNHLSHFGFFKPTSNPTRILCMSFVLRWSVTVGFLLLNGTRFEDTRYAIRLAGFLVRECVKMLDPRN